MINTGTNTDYSSKMPDLADDANIQEALQTYHYGTLDPTLSDSASFVSGSGFGDPDYGMVGKLKWIKTEIDAIKASGASGGMFNSIIDAKGDLIVGTAADTPAKMSAGANGYVLQVDTSNLTYGLKWGNLDDTHLNLTGGTLTGDFEISKATPSLSILASSGASTINFQAPSGSTKGLKIKTGSSLRWELLSNSTSESSTATGSDLVINRYNNSGSLLGAVVTVTRSSGLVALANDVTVGGALTVTSNSTFSGLVSASTTPTSSAHLTNKAYVDKSMPVGTVVAYAGTAAPTGWVICDGQTLNRTTYASLYSVCGTAYGAGDGSTTFNVPDLVDRFVKGAGTAVTTLGGRTSPVTERATAGTKTVPVPQHTHSATVTVASGGSHTHTASTDAQGNHSHLYNAQYFATGMGTGGSSVMRPEAGATTTASTVATGNHKHNITVDSGGSHGHSGSTVSVSNYGTAGATMEPQHYTMYYIIKAE